ncbi:colicin release lysis protein [Escherichia coli]|nr:colicin release lysis protein [Escherichia coli]
MVEIMCGKILLILLFIMTLSACQVNHIRDVKGGTVAPSSSSELMREVGVMKRSKDPLEILFFCA